MSDDKVHRYDGAAAEVAWDGRLCIHIGECGRANNDLFVGGRDPWCAPDQVDVDEALEVVRRCPTGAITLRRKDGAAAEAPAPTNRLTVANRGPLYLRGDLRIEGAPEDMPGVAFRAALCRCGQTKNRPFCDNSHEGSGFADHGAIGDAGPGLEAEGGPIEVKPLKNGPLRLTGNLVMVSGAGVETWRGTKAFLCRCGESKNRPFCDGTHNKVGFETDD